MNSPSLDRAPVPGKIDRADFQIDGPLMLASDEVALWHVDLNAVAGDQSRWQELLSVGERERAARFHFERDRKNFSATRGLLRVVLGAYLSMPPAEIAFTYSEKGKPASAKPSHNPHGINFNVSHSGEAALFGFTHKSQIGVDIEKIRRDFDMLAIARRFFSAQEQTELASLPEAQQAQAFFRTWTLKESFIKALGEGLSHPLHQFDVSVAPGSAPSLVTRPDAQDAANWKLQVIDVDAGYAAAFAVSRH